MILYLGPQLAQLISEVLGIEFEPIGLFYCAVNLLIYYIFAVQL